MDEILYRQRLADTDDFAPGWDAIDEAFGAVYPRMTVHHYGTEMSRRATLGGDLYLDGISYYQSAGGYWHGVSYGLSAPYGDIDAFGKDYSGTGTELTIKAPDGQIDAVLWTSELILALAGRVFTRGKPYTEGSIISVGGPIHTTPNTTLTGYICVLDTVVDPIATPHGVVEFVQLVGVTSAELEAFAQGATIKDFKEAAIAAGNPNLVLDLVRRSYL